MHLVRIVNGFSLSDTPFMNQHQQTAPPNFTRIVVLLLILAAFFLRTYNLSTVPPGLYYDEAAHGLDALHIWQGQILLYFPTGAGHEPLFTYLVAGFVRLLDNTIWAIRLPAAMLGTLAVSATFALGRRLVGPLPALLGAGLVAVTFWTVALSRMGYRANTLPVLFPLWLLSFWHCRNRRELAPYLVSGLLLGLTQYTYTATRFIPLLVLLLAFDWRKTLDRRGLLIGAGVALLVALPLGWAILNAPEMGGHRIRQAALWNRPEPWSLLWLQVRDHLLMFGIRGDPLWIHNLPLRPPVALPIAVLFVAGVVTGWRMAAQRALVWAVAVMVWPGILAVSNNPAPPDHLRVLVLAAPIFLLAGAGLAFLTRRRPTWLPALVFALIIADGLLSWRDYQQWSVASETYEQFDADMTRIAQKVAAQPDRYFLVPISSDWQELTPGHHWTIDYLSHEQGNVWVAGPPYTLPPFEEDQVALVRWQAGMHLEADPQRTLEGQLQLAGYTKINEETERTFVLTNYQRSGEPVTITRLAPNHTFAGGLRIIQVNLYQRQSSTIASPLIAEVVWESEGVYPHPLAVSLRLLDATGALAAQVDSALWNELGKTAEKWRSKEQSRLFLELDIETLPAGDYHVVLFPYEAESLAPLPSAEGAASEMIGVLSLGDASP
jgi:hypothetical protein